MTHMAANHDWFDDPLWYKDAIIYQLHIKAFFDSNNDGIGDFPGLTAKLDYIQELGVNTVWILPFYPSPMKDDGYDIAEYTGIYPQYGTIGDFDRFIEEAHRRKLKVITELVINHTSDQHPWFQAARHAPPGSAEREFYVWSDTDEKFPETRIIFTDTEVSNWAWDDVAQAYYFHRFFSHQPDLNHNNPAVVEAVTRVMRFWLDKGVDGLRLDAIPYLCVREGTNNENLPETHAVIRRMRAVVDANYAGRVFLAEANQWPEDVRDYFGQGDECHMAYHFPLMPRIFMAVALEDRYPVTEILRQTPAIPENCQWAIFLRNHDELTLEMVTDQERDYMYRMYAQEPRMRINVGIRRRLAPLLGNESERIKLVMSLLLSMPGSPILYYGDEIGMGDNIFLGDRNGVRTPMQWSPDRNAGFSRADPQQLFLPAIMDPIFGFQAVNVEAQSRESSSLLNWVKRILAIRQQHLLFGRGAIEFVRPANRKIMAYVRSLGDDTVLCVSNLSHTAQAVELDLARYRGRVPIELSGGSAFPPIGDLPYLLTLPGHGFFWLHLVEGSEPPAWHTNRLPATELPVIVLSDDLDTFLPNAAQEINAVKQRALAMLEADVLPQFLGARNWSRREDAAIQSVALGQPASWHSAHGHWLLANPRITYADGVQRTYFLPLAILWDDEAPARGPATGPFTIAKVRQRARSGLLLDAMGDASFCLQLTNNFRTMQILPAPEGTWRFTPTARFAELTRGGLTPIELVPGEPHTTAIIFSESLFLRCYRHIQPGTNPDVAMTRTLTEHTSFRNIAALAGTIEYCANDGPTATIAAAFAFARNQGDGWTYTLDHLQRFAADLHSEDSVGLKAAHDLYLAQVHILGQRIGELHRALSTLTTVPEFSPEPVSHKELQHWARAVAQLAKPATVRLDELVRSATGSAREDVLLLRTQIRHIRNTLTSLTQHPIVAYKTRLHGNLHLGRVLMAADDLLITHFQGDPGLAFEFRCRKHSPLRDVATLLRSLDRARAVGLDRASAGQVTHYAALAPHFADWLASARRSVLTGYRVGVADAVCCPGAADDFTSLLTLFELEFAFRALLPESERRRNWSDAPVARLNALLSDVPA